MKPDEFEDAFQIETHGVVVDREVLGVDFSGRLLDLLRARTPDLPKPEEIVADTKDGKTYTVWPRFSSLSPYTDEAVDKLRDAIESMKDTPDIST